MITNPIPLVSLMHTFILGLHGGMYIYFDLFFCALMLVEAVLDRNIYRVFFS